MAPSMWPSSNSEGVLTSRMTMSGFSSMRALASATVTSAYSCVGVWR